MSLRRATNGGRRFSGAFARGAFSPSSLSGLVGWWDFSDASTLTLATAEVTVAADKAAVGLGSVVPVTTGPTLVSAGQNGLDYADFSETPLVSAAPVSSLFGADGEASIFVVGTWPGANQGLVDIGTGATTTNNGALMFSTGAEAARAQCFGVDGLVTSTVADPVVLTPAWRVAVGLYGATVVARLAGGEGSPATAGGLRNGASLDQVTIGGLGGAGGTFPASANIGEVIILDRLATATEVAEIEAYLTAKWGL